LPHSWAPSSRPSIGAGSSADIENGRPVDAAVDGFPSPTRGAADVVRSGISRYPGDGAHAIPYRADMPRLELTIHLRVDLPLGESPYCESGVNKKRDP
jgi:hypothetical protein